MKIGLLQYDIVWEDTSANLLRLDALFKSIPGVDLVVLPEMFNTGFSMSPVRIAESDNGPATRWLQEVSRKNNIAICGSIAIGENDRYYNRLKVFNQGELCCQYDKHNLFTLAGEEKYYTRGLEQVTFQLAEWKIKPLVCYDLRFPIWCYNREMADLVVFCANWPDARSEHWRSLLRARAIENQCFVVGVNRVGHDGAGLMHSGYSAIINPRGEYIAEIENNAGLFIHEINQDEVTQFRAQLRSLQEGVQDDQI